MAEINLFGVYFSGALATAVIAAIAWLVVHRLLTWADVYRHTWHHNLVDVALLVLLWALSAWVLDISSRGIK